MMKSFVANENEIDYKFQNFVRKKQSSNFNKMMIFFLNF